MNDYAYLRTSSQKKEDPNKISLSMQFALIKEQAQNENLMVFEDMNVSGTKTSRPGLNSLLHQIETNDGAGRLYIYRWDRLARNISLMIDIYDLCAKNNVTIISIKDPLPESMAQSEALGRLYLQTLWIFSEAKLDMVKDNQKIALASKRKKNLPLSYKAPYGYRKKGKSFVVKFEEAENVRLIFKLYLEGQGYQKIVKYLTNNGFKMKIREFRPYNIKQILINPFYYGYHKGGQFRSYQGLHEPIIEKRIFEKAQKIRESKHINKIHKTSFLLRKKISCPLCSKVLTTNTQKRKENRYSYYVCPNCKKISLSASKIENEALSIIKEFLTIGDTYVALKKSMAKQISLKKNEQQQNEKSQMINKSKLMEQFEDGALTHNELLKKLKEIPANSTNTIFDEENKLQVKFDQLLKMEKSPFDGTLLEQIDHLTITTDKKIKEIFLYGMDNSII